MSRQGREGINQCQTKCIWSFPLSLFPLSTISCLIGIPNGRETKERERGTKERARVLLDENEESGWASFGLYCNKGQQASSNYWLNLSHCRKWPLAKWPPHSHEHKWRDWTLDSVLTLAKMQCLVLITLKVTILCYIKVIRQKSGCQ